MYLLALVRDKDTKETTCITNDTYSSKRKFADDIKRNGYSVIRVSNNRDLKAMDFGYESFNDMKKFAAETAWDAVLHERIKEIEQIEL